MQNSLIIGTHRKGNPRCRSRAGVEPFLSAFPSARRRRHRQHTRLAGADRPLPGTSEGRTRWASGVAELGSYLTDATREGRSRRVVRIPPLCCRPNVSLKQSLRHSDPVESCLPPFRIAKQLSYSVAAACQGCPLDLGTSSGCSTAKSRAGREGVRRPRRCQ
jgi:hypothetical protein